MKAIVTVGLGFGDEGKGACVDALTRQLNADLVVRYSGGAQAGHNVETSDGRRHTFSQFGAGTLAGARTYLGPRMIICPETMIPEAQHLVTLGVDDPWSLLAVHPDCLVSTAYHILMNRLRESSRGADRHGSCGLGIGETRHYWLRDGRDAITAKDLFDRQVLLSKLTLLRERCLLEMQELPRIDSAYAATLHATWSCDVSASLRRAAQRITLTDTMPTSQTAIFEGSQGVLLDEWKGFHPYTTWSTVTPQHALEMLSGYPSAEVTVLGITRAYATRHGAGPFPTWSRSMSRQMTDDGNPRNDWQGSIRFGSLDLVLTEYAARVSQIDALVVNGLDQLTSRPRITTSYRELKSINTPGCLREQEQLTSMLASVHPIEMETSRDDLLGALEAIAPIVGTGHGPSSNDRQFQSRFENAGRRERQTTP